MSPRVIQNAAGMLLGASLLLVSCAERPPKRMGEGCELTTDCEAPFVCTLGACREACREGRDCRPGTTCVRDPEGFGVCQLASEAECVLNSDCPDGLVCRFEQCTNACLDDRDCINGLSCVAASEGASELACRDTFEVECRVSSECGGTLICARDGRCREQCRADRDCRDGRICDATGAERVCILPNPLDRPPPAPTFAAGGATTCASSTDGLELRCFGRNSSGEVGGGTTSPTAPPSNVLVGAPIVALSVGDRHTCAIDDALRCWGDGSDGQLGLGPGVTVSLSPAAVPMVTGAIGVAAGFAHTCAWTDTELRCWGRNDRGQLGDGTLVGRFDPTGPLPRVSPVVHAAGGEGHSCAVRDDGTLFCWGDNDSGQLGDGTLVSQLTPSRALVSDVVEVVAGRAHTCALRRDRQVRCWGEGLSGQTGAGMVEPVSGVVAPAGLEAVVQIAAGAEHTCVREESGAVKCFGAATEGQLGAAPADGVSATPIAVPLVSPAVEVRAGHRYTCARLDDLSAYCFGENGDGQFGVSATGGPTPTLTTAL